MVCEAMLRTPYDYPSFRTEFIKLFINFRRSVGPARRITALVTLNLAVSVKTSSGEEVFEIRFGSDFT